MLVRIEKKGLRTRSLSHGTEGVAAIAALMVVEDLVVKLCPETCAGDAACGTTNQAAQDGSGETANSDTDRTSHRPHESTCLGTTERPCRS